ncbi:unnamed protein product [Orchesella dallaii]|uniref:Uncharacterized protein n=1 Tax=Orchesella dallaii TaxID=48710 RepID=A0ABP1S6I8_9HEXA
MENGQSFSTKPEESSSKESTSKAAKQHQPLYLVPLEQHQKEDPDHHHPHENSQTTTDSQSKPDKFIPYGNETLPLLHLPTTNYRSIVIVSFIPIGIIDIAHELREGFWNLETFVKQTVECQLVQETENFMTSDQI